MMLLNTGDFSQNSFTAFPDKEVVWIKTDSLVLGSSTLKPVFKIRDMDCVNM